MGHGYLESSQPPPEFAEGIGAWRKAVLTSAQMTLRPLAAASAVSTTVRAAVGRHADGARTSLFDAPPQTLPSCQYQLALVLLSSEARRLRCLRLVPRHAACDAEPPEVVHWWMKPHRLESSKGEEYPPESRRDLCFGRHALGCNKPGRHVA